MSWLPSSLRRLGALFRWRQFEQDLDDEVRFHVETETQENIRRGMAPADARRAALVSFGGVERFKEETRDARGLRLIDQTLQDVHYGVRLLLKRPGFTIVLVLTLALGVGANSAIFSVVNAVLFQDLPYAEPDRLVLVWNRTRNSPSDLRVSAPDVAVYREHTRLFEAFSFITSPVDVALTADGHAEHARLGRASSNLFDVLGIHAAVGRTFLPGEGIIPPELLQDSTATVPPSVVVLSHGFWQRRFGGDSSVLGERVDVRGQAVIVIGVLPETFTLLLPETAGLATTVDAWMPIRFDLSSFRRIDGRLRDQDSDNTGVVIARLKPGATLQQGQAEMEDIAAQQRRALPSYAEAGMRIAVIGMHDNVVGHLRPSLVALLGAVTFVLLVACLNVANLLLARGSTRRHEMALRAAIGADRSRLVRQVLIENGVLALLAGGVGLALAQIGIVVLMRLRPANLPRLDSVSIDGSVLAFTLGVTALATLLFGVVPAITQSTIKPFDALRQRGLPRHHRGRASLRSGFIVAELALSLILLTGAGLMLKSFWRLADVRPGFDAEQVLAFHLSLTAPEGYRGPAARAAFVHEFENRIRALPGVQATGAVGGLPLEGRIWIQPYGLPGQSLEEWSRNEANFRVITSGYFRAMGTALVAGRRFTEDEDLHEERRVVIVDVRLAERLGHGNNVVGRFLSFPLDGDPITAEIVGIVEHVRHETLRRDGRPTIYVPYRQEASRDIAVVVRTVGDPAAIAGPIRTELRILDHRLPMYDVRTMASHVAAAIAPTRFALTLMAIFAGIALTLASVGLYGLIAYTVNQRTQEIGVRMALGARQRDVVRHVTGRGMMLAGLGLVIGLAAAALLSRTLSALLFEVRPTDGATYLGVSVLLGGVALVASYIPARRASKVDPVTALRAD